MSGLFLTGVSHLATTVVFIESVALLFVSRLSPLVLLLAYVAFSVTFLDLATTRPLAVPEEPSRWRRILIVAGVATIVGSYVMWLRSISLLL